jgi:glycerophosphoryl diester phosphodiesterase
VLLLGHRGARRYAPENTVAAFDLAIQHGCHGFEFDVRLTADQQCVICHDPQLSGRTVAISRYDTLEPAPCLSDVLEKFAASAYLDIELKVGGLEAQVASLLRKYVPLRGYWVSSFLPQVIEAVHAKDGTIPLGLICESRRQLAEWPKLPIQSAFLKHSLVTEQVVSELHAANKQVFVWTVNSASEMRDFAGKGVDGIISDDTKLLVETLRPKP